MSFASSAADSPSRRSWRSESITRAPSSAQRRAVAKPIPVPAAAVTSTVLPASRPWEAGVGRGGDLGPGHAVLVDPRLAREAEPALGDDVALDLVGSAVEGVRAREEEQALEGAELVGGALQHRGFVAQHVHRELAEVLVPGRPVELVDHRLARQLRGSRRPRACAARSCASPRGRSRRRRGAGAAPDRGPCRCARAIWMTCSSSLRKLRFWPSVEAPRSKASVPIATFQPSPGWPTTFPASLRAPSKKTSLNSESPVSWRIGRTSIPGWRIGTSR